MENNENKNEIKKEIKKLNHLEVFNYICRDNLNENDIQTYNEKINNNIKYLIENDKNFENKGNGLIQIDEKIYVEKEEKAMEEVGKVIEKDLLNNVCENLITILQNLKSILLPPPQDDLKPTLTTDNIPVYDDKQTDYKKSLIIDSIPTDNEIIIDLSKNGSGVLQGKIKIRGCDIIEGNIIIEHSKYLHTPATFTISPALPFSLNQLKDLKNHVTQALFLLTHLKKFSSTLPKSEIVNV